MTEDQFARLLRNVNQMRPEKFASAEPIEWKNWRANFIICVSVNGWDHRRARREAAAAMVGLAKSYVSDIALGDDAGAANYTGLLDLYQARFCPGADSDLARVALRQARQKETESVVAWHARVRHLYQRAHPDLAADLLNDARNLMDAFMWGLYDPDVQADTWKSRPATFAACLENANNFVASQRVLKSRSGGNGASGSNDYGILAMDEYEGPSTSSNNAISDRCYVCDKPGHFQRDCIIHKRATARRRAARRGRGGGWRGGSSGGRGGSRRGRGSKSFNRSWKRSSNNRSVNQLESHEDRSAEVREDAGEAREGQQGNE